MRRRLGSSGSVDKATVAVGGGGVAVAAGVSWRRILLLIIAITVHNIPGNYAAALCLLMIHEKIMRKSVIVKSSH